MAGSGQVSSALRVICPPTRSCSSTASASATADSRSVVVVTSPGCPIGPQVAEQMEEFVGELEGVQEVQPTMTFSPPWTPERMSEDAKFALGF